MPSTIEQTKEAILKHRGKASKHQIARELKISLDYAGLILDDLKRKGEIVFSGGFYILTPLEKSHPKAVEAVPLAGRSLTVLASAQKNVNQKKLKKLLKKPITPLPAKQSARRSRKSKGTKKARKPKVGKNATHPRAVFRESANNWHEL